MFEPTSRYYTIQNAVYEDDDGHKFAYKRRRFLPQGECIPVMRAATVQEHARLDQITAASLGDPEQFWRICDANNAMNPLDLVAQPGQVLRIPVPQFEDTTRNPLGLLVGLNPMNGEE